MKNLKIAALCIGLTTASVAVPVYAETAPAPKADTTKADAPKADAPKADTTKSDTTKSDTTKADTTKADAPKTDVAKPDKAETKPAASDAEKRAKAVDCSKQADAKKLHGEERKKFRSECKRAA